MIKKHIEAILNKEAKFIKNKNEFAIAIEHAFYEDFNQTERKFLDFLDIVDYTKWHITQAKIYNL